MGLMTRLAGHSDVEHADEHPNPRVRAIWHGAVVAESDRTVVVEGNHYFPPDSLRREYFTESRRRSVCPWKGIATYYSLEVGGERNEGAAWTYPKPTPLARKIKGHVAFWNGVDVGSAE